MMKKLIKILVFLFAAIWIQACGENENNKIIPPPPPPPENEWILEWSDEFDYSGLPDSKKWRYDEGFIRNNEKQYYTVNRIENAFVKDGLLTIKCIKESYKNKDYGNESLAKDPDHHWKTVDENASYTSASINTRGKYEWTYGKVEVRAKLPSGAGVWPAIWTMGGDIHTVGWPKSGEIDIMEFVGNQPNQIQANFHYPNQQTGLPTQKPGTTKVEKPWEDFHIYAMEWDENVIKISYDGRVFHTFNTKLASGTFNKPNYLILNFALGGDMGGEIDDSNLPQEYQIDYVRVYSLKKPSAK